MPALAQGFLRLGPVYCRILCHCAAPIAFPFTCWAISFMEAAAPWFLVFSNVFALTLMNFGVQHMRSAILPAGRSFSWGTRRDWHVPRMEAPVYIGTNDSLKSSPEKASERFGKSWNTEARWQQSRGDWRAPITLEVGSGKRSRQVCIAIENNETLAPMWQTRDATRGLHC